MEQFAGLTMFFFADTTHAITERPLVCGSCRKPSFIFVNRNGRTLCAGCDGKESPVCP